MLDDKDDKLRQLHEHYGKLVRAVAAGRINNYEDATDVCQETFIALYKNYDLYLPENEIKALLLKIAVNKSADYLRKKNKREKAENSYGKIWCNELMTKPLEDHVENREELRKVMFELEAMKDIYKDPFNLYAIQGRCAEEVCGMLGISEDVLHSRVYRARKILRKNILGEKPYNDS